MSSREFLGKTTESTSLYREIMGFADILILPFNQGKQEMSKQGILGAQHILQ